MSAAVSPLNSENMKGGSQFRGSTYDQDPKYQDKHKKLKSSLSFPKKYDTKIRREAIKLEALKDWIARRVTELLDLEDEVVIEYAYSLVEQAGFFFEKKFVLKRV